MAISPKSLVVRLSDAEKDRVKQLEEVPRSKTYYEIAEERARAQGGETGQDAFDPKVKQELETLARERVEYFLDVASFPAQRLMML